jgi:pyruvate dehydrogenase E2 component (dihydrolipoamide acetyltransferase)
MSELITLPKLGFDMAEGTLVRWLKQVGDQVKKGEVLLEVETDKATVEVEALASGLLRGTFAEAGSVLPVGTLIGVIAGAEEKVDLDTLRAQAGGAPTVPAPGSKAVTAAQIAPPPVSATPKPAAAVPATDGVLRVSPIAQRMAAQAGIDLKLVRGSGPEGRIIKRDIELLVAGGAPAQPVAAARPHLAAGSVPASRLRKAIARRMTESKTTIPHFYLTVDVDMADVVRVREQLNSMLEASDAKVSINDFIVKGAALALLKFPNLNGVYRGDALELMAQVHVGVAVSVPGGLLTVVVRDADSKPLATIGAEVRAMAARAREGKVQPADIEGSTFTTSNLGMYGIEHFAAIINPPEVAILATGAVQAVPVVRNGQVVPGTILRATLSGDHRVTDGAEGAQFIQYFKQLLEQPLRLVV